MTLHSLKILQFDVRFLNHLRNLIVALTDSTGAYLFSDLGDSGIVDLTIFAKDRSVLSSWFSLHRFLPFSKRKIRQNSKEWDISEMEPAKFGNIQNLTCIVRGVYPVFGWFWHFSAPSSLDCSQFRPRWSLGQVDRNLAKTGASDSETVGAAPSSLLWSSHFSLKYDVRSSLHLGPKHGAVWVTETWVFRVAQLISEIAL